MTVSLNTNAINPAALAVAKPSPAGVDGADGSDQGVASAPGSAQGSTQATDSQAAAFDASAYSISASALQSASDLETVSGVTPVLDGDGARLMALQIQQALSDAPGAITSSSTQSVLALFKN